MEDQPENRFWNYHYRFPPAKLIISKKAVEK